MANCGRMVVPSLTPYDLPFPPNGGSNFHMPPTYANGHISATGDPIHFTRVGFSGTADLMALFSIEQFQDGGRRHLG